MPSQNVCFSLSPKRRSLSTAPGDEIAVAEKSSRGAGFDAEAGGTGSSGIVMAGALIRTPLRMRPEALVGGIILAFPPNKCYMTGSQFRTALPRSGALLPICRCLSIGPREAASY